MVRLIAFLLLTPLLHAQTPAPTLPDKDTFHLYLLIGQSNMAGRGKISPQDKVENARVLMFTRDRRWTPAVAPLHFDKPRMVGVGLGRSFGLAIAEATPGVTIGLIPCAVGGSPIDTWREGAYYPVTKSHPWDDAISRSREALRFGTLKGILWHQGESDSKETLAPTYEKKLHDLISRLRRELAAPDVPFILGQMGQFKERPWDEFRRQVDQAHREVPAKITRTAFVSSDGLHHKGDEVHFDAPSYREFGRRYAAAYFKLRDE